MSFGLLASVLFAGCCQTTSFDRSAMMSRLQTESASVTVSDDEIVQVQAIKPQLQFPCRVAVYLSPAVQWSIKDKERIKAWGDSLKKEGIVSDYFLMSSLFSPNAASLASKAQKEVRLAAARHGADAVLILHGIHQTESYENPAALLNLTLVGGYIIPASHRDVLFMLQGAVVDVGNGFLYASVESEGTGKIMRPSFIIEEKDALDAARKEAIEGFGPDFLRRMQSLNHSYRQSPLVPARLGGALPATANK
jgi:rhombotail lipoprotein